MNARSFLDVLTEHRLVVVVRLPGAELLDPLARTAAEAGVALLEVSLTTPGAVDWVAANATRHPGMHVGLGTVCSTTDAEGAVGAGAAFLLAPNVEPTVMAVAAGADTAMVPGAFTATEAVVAATHGAAAIKLFPASTGGPAHLRALRGPLPDLDFVPVGGVDDGNASTWLRAGAVGVGVGGAAVPESLVAAENFDGIGERLERLVAVCGDGAA